MDDARRCVLCRVRPADPRWRPFCSERCRTEDLARWADERYRIPAESAPLPQSDANADHADQ